VSMFKVAIVKSGLNTKIRNLSVNSDVTNRIH
jgi:hypothetical protein